jgi:hypothetical protein
MVPLRGVDELFALAVYVIAPFPEAGPLAVIQLTSGVGVQAQLLITPKVPLPPK